MDFCFTPIASDKQSEINSQKFTKANYEYSNSSNYDSSKKQTDPNRNGCENKAELKAIKNMEIGSKESNENECIGDEIKPSNIMSYTYNNAEK